MAQDEGVNVKVFLFHNYAIPKCSGISCEDGTAALEIIKASNTALH